MDYFSRDRIRRGVRAVVYRACWRRLEGDEAGADALLASELREALSDVTGTGLEDPRVQTWLDEDMADFDRAVLISDLVARRAATVAPAAAALKPSSVPGPAMARPGDVERPRRDPAGAPAIADLLDGMLAQERQRRAAG